ncbi:MAG: ATP-binding cassette domain-containing protein [Anaerorhabdus sp.]
MENLKKNLLIFDQILRIFNSAKFKLKVIYVVYILSYLINFISLPLLTSLFFTSKDKSNIYILLVLYLISSVIQEAVEQLIIFYGNSYRMEQIKLSFNKCLSIDYQFLESKKGQELFNKALLNTNSSSASFSIIHLLIVRCLFSFIFIIFTFVMAIIALNSEIRIIFIIMCALILIINFIFNEKDKIILGSIREFLSNINRDMNYLRKISKNKDTSIIINHYQKSEMIKKKFLDLKLLLKKKYDKAYKAMKKNLFFSNLSLLIIQVITFIITIKVLGIKNEQIILLIPLLWQYNKSSAILTINIQDLNNAILSVNNFYKFLDWGIDKDKNREKVNDVRDIEFESVNFKYNEQDEFGLKQFNLKIKSGEKIGIVGINGSGKTTIIKLLLNFYKSNSGSIKINGKDVNIISNLHDLISSVFQNDIVIPGTIRENILMGRKFDKEKFQEVIEKVGLDALLTKKKISIDSNVSTYYFKDGIELSTGEKQLILLARCLYKDSPIVVLDEPSAALDPIAELKLFNLYNKLIEDKIGLFITHRCTSVEVFDKIIVVINGEIKEVGNFDELIKKDGVYAKMYRAQSEAYREEN